MKTTTIKLTRDNETRIETVMDFILDDYAKAMKAYGWKVEKISK